MIPLLILPFVAALALQRFWPRAHRALRQRQSISFYLWAVSLTIVMGNTTSFLIRQDSSRYGDELLLAGASLVACVCQFVIGRRIGRKYDLKISGAQGLGQKNTVLASSTAGNCGRKEGARPSSKSEALDTLVLRPRSRQENSLINVLTGTSPHKPASRVSECSGYGSRISRT